MGVSALLETRNLCCERDERVLFKDLNIQIMPGQVVQIEGPNGSGKTTLLRILCGLSSNYTGDIYYCDENIDDSRLEFYENLLFIGHKPGVKGILTAQENLRWFAAMHSVNYQSLHESQAIDQALDQVGLYGFEDVPCHYLSAGQQRRVGLARLYLTASPVWILDEPFTAIDKNGVAQLENLVAKHAEKGGTVVLTTHHQLTMNSPLVRVALG